MRRGPWLALVLLLPLLFGSGCVAPLLIEMFKDPMGREAALRQAQRAYTNAVRWGNVEQAAHFVHPDLRDRFLGFEAEFDGIRVTDFEVGQIEYAEGQSTATVRVTYHAYSMTSMVETEIKEMQKWERLGKGNEWVVRPQIEGLVGQVTDLL